MKEVVVSIADMKFSNNPEVVLVTYALGSCIAVSIYDPFVKVGGLLHYMLPDSSLDKERAEKSPFMFADTGVTMLFKSCYRMGAEKKRIVIKVAGGASIIDNTNYFRIGEKNIMALRRLFWKNNVFVDGEDTGKTCNRTIRLAIATGDVFVKRSDGVTEQL